VPSRQPPSTMAASATIHLVRHARVDYVHDERWMNAAGVQRFEDGYNAADIHGDSHPPAELVAIAAKATVVAASDMRRAIASVQRLVPGREADITPLLREITLETPAWVRFPLPILGWDVISHSLVSWYIARSRDHEFLRRAELAAHWLAERAAESASVVAVTHGGFRRILDHRLVTRGWARIPGSRSYENWSVWSYTR
jgi:broad specificity phosphatase PhoE